MLRETVAETVGEIKERAENAAAITNTTVCGVAYCQAFYFEFDEIYLTEEAWTTSDSLEALLARELDDVIYTSEGIYDKDLQLFLQAQAVVVL